MVRAIDVAKLLLAWAKENGDVITNLKLQKLLYYAQAWHLVNFGKPLFSDDVEAWDFGPVVRPVYSKWKRYGGTSIPYRPTGKEAEVFTDSQIHFLLEFYRVFSSLSATALVSMTRSEDPWKNAFARGLNSVISHKDMKEYYTRLYKQKYAKKRQAGQEA